MTRPDLCLDFANTRYWRGQATPTETLNAPADLAARIKAPKAPSPKEFEQAVALRETIYRLFDAQTQGKVATRDLEALNQALAQAPARKALKIRSVTNISQHPIRQIQVRSNRRRKHVFRLSTSKCRQFQR